MDKRVYLQLLQLLHTRQLLNRQRLKAYGRAKYKTGDGRSDEYKELAQAIKRTTPTLRRLCKELNVRLQWDSSWNVISIHDEPKRQEIINSCEFTRGYYRMFPRDSLLFEISKDHTLEKELNRTLIDVAIIELLTK